MGRRQRLVARREELGLSRERLGEAVGVHFKTVARWEQGVSVPYASQRPALAGALRWSMAQLALALADDDEDDEEQDDGRGNGHAGATTAGGAPSTNGGGRGTGVNGERRRGRTGGVNLLAQMEESASELRTWEPIAVPGLLQIEAYACAVEAVGPEHVTPEEIARRVKQRLARQTVLERLRFYALLDESVLLRETGGPAVMATQLDHLRDMAERPNVDIRVVPLDQRAHAGGRGGFKLVGAGPSVVVTEDLSSGFSYRESRSVVQAHARLWAYLWEAGRDVAQVELQRP
jgi:DNA-binding XRE family transcriptional regulator